MLPPICARFVGESCLIVDMEIAAGHADTSYRQGRINRNCKMERRTNVKAQLR
jgi:hypothetical protein